MKLTAHQKAGLAHIKAEKRRHAALTKAYFAYVEKARKLGFHPLNQIQLGDRSRQLVAMEDEYRSKEWAERAEFTSSLRKAAA